MCSGPAFSQLAVDIKDLFIFVLCVVLLVFDVAVVVTAVFTLFSVILWFGYKSIINHIRQLVDHYPLFYTKLTSFLPKSLLLFSIYYIMCVERSLRLFFNSWFHCFLFFFLSFLWFRICCLRRIL